MRKSGSCARCELAQWSAISVVDGLRLCGELAPRFAANRGLLLPVLLTQARLHSFAGDLGGAGPPWRSFPVTRTACTWISCRPRPLRSAGWSQHSAELDAAALLRYREAEALLRMQQRLPEADDMRTLVARAQCELGLLPEARSELAALRDADMSLRTR